MLYTDEQLIFQSLANLWSWASQFESYLKFGAQKLDFLLTRLNNGQVNILDALYFRILQLHFAWF